jgi:hypothetical protein
MTPTPKIRAVLGPKIDIVSIDIYSALAQVQWWIAFSEGDHYEWSLPRTIENAL